MRLIDGDALYDALADKLLWLMQYGDDTYLSVGNDIRKTIADQPTAYDVDKVAEQLDDYLFDKYCVEGDSKIYEIVKGGGEDAGSI